MEERDRPLNTSWTRGYYDDVYARRWALGPPTAEHSARAAALVAMLGATAGRNLLDVGCGHGRYAVAFRRLGLSVVGVDPSAALLALAADMSSEQATEVALVRGDSRALPFTGVFDHAVMIDAFGFFASADEDTQALASVRGALVGNGTVVVKLANGAAARRAAVEQSLIRVEVPPAGAEDGRDPNRPLVETIRLEVSADGDRVIEHITLEDCQGRVATRREERLYDPRRIRAAMESVGFDVIGVFEDLVGTPATEKALPMFVLARA